MDFRGQKQAEQLCMYIIIAAGVVAFVSGFTQNSFALMMKVYGSGVAVAMVACIPDWPWFNSNTPKWLPAESKAAQQGAGRAIAS